MVQPSNELGEIRVQSNELGWFGAGGGRRQAGAQAPRSGEKIQFGGRKKGIFNGKMAFKIVWKMLKNRFLKSIKNPYLVRPHPPGGGGVGQPSNELGVRFKKSNELPPYVPAPIILSQSSS